MLVILRRRAKRGLEGRTALIRPTNGAIGLLPALGRAAIVSAERLG
jgi:hypothetical protein